MPRPSKNRPSHPRGKTIKKSAEKYRQMQSQLQAHEKERFSHHNQRNDLPVAGKSNTAMSADDMMKMMIKGYESDGSNTGQEDKDFGKERHKSSSTVQNSYYNNSNISDQFINSRGNGSHVSYNNSTYNNNIANNYNVSSYSNNGLMTHAPVTSMNHINQNNGLMTHAPVTSMNHINQYGQSGMGMSQPPPPINPLNQINQYSQSAMVMSHPPVNSMIHNNQYGQWGIGISHPPPPVNSMNQMGMSHTPVPSMNQINQSGKSGISVKSRLGNKKKIKKWKLDAKNKRDLKNKKLVNDCHQRRSSMATLKRSQKPTTSTTSEYDKKLKGNDDCHQRRPSMVTLGRSQKPATSTISKYDKKSNSGIPTEYLNCHMCCKSDFTCVLDYLNHLDSTIHSIISQIYHRKCMTTLHTLRLDAALASQRIMDYSQKAEHCSICQCSFQNIKVKHSKTIEHKLVLNYITVLCCGKTFENRGDFEEHKLSIDHLRFIGESEMQSKGADKKEQKVIKALGLEEKSPQRQQIGLNAVGKPGPKDINSKMELDSLSTLPPFDSSSEIIEDMEKYIQGHDTPKETKEENTDWKDEMKMMIKGYEYEENINVNNEVSVKQKRKQVKTCDIASISEEDESIIMTADDIMDILMDEDETEDSDTDKEEEESEKEHKGKSKRAKITDEDDVNDRFGEKEVHKKKDEIDENKDDSVNINELDLDDIVTVDIELCNENENMDEDDRKKEKSVNEEIKDDMNNEETEKQIKEKELDKKKSLNKKEVVEEKKESEKDNEIVEEKDVHKKKDKIDENREDNENVNEKESNLKKETEKEINEKQTKEKKEVEEEKEVEEKEVEEKKVDKNEIHEEKKDNSPRKQKLKRKRKR